MYTRASFTNGRVASNLLLKGKEYFQKTNLVSNLLLTVRAALHEESRPIWGYDMRKCLYMIGLIHKINLKAFT